jgi:hypothetical protein
VSLRGWTRARLRTKPGGETPDSRLRRLAATGSLAAVCSACAATPAPPPRAQPAADSVSDGATVERFFQIEREALDWVAAADPRLAARAQLAPSDGVLKRIGTEAVLAEDVAAQIRGGSLDLFAFQGRARALLEAAHLLEGDRERLPETAAPAAPLARPRLERELIGRLIDEERARAADEANLREASGDLVRGILSTWTPAAAPQDWEERDVWVSKHLLEIRESLRDREPAGGPLDLDTALYPLERLLAPLEFPRGAAAIAQVRLALDADTRAFPPLVNPARIAAEVELHLGLKIDPSAMGPRLARLGERLRVLAQHALEESAGPPAAIARAARLLLVEASCPAVTGTLVRAMAPPPERAAICGAIRALTEEPDAAAGLVALHDDVLLAFAGITTTPPPRTQLLSNPDNDEVDTLLRSVRERPVPSLGVALAAELLYGNDGGDGRLRTWRGLGEAPLDVMAREIGAPIPSPSS